MNTNSPVRRAGITIDLSEIPMEERFKICKLALSIEESKNCEDKVDIPVSDKISISEFNKIVKKYHDEISLITNSSNNKLSQNSNMNVYMKYITSDAKAKSSAYISIIPTPIGSKLYIESSDIDYDINDDGSVAFVGESISLEIPFSFIKNNKFIFYRTNYDGLERFFYYDLENEKQHEVPNIQSRDDWNDFKIRKKGLGKDNVLESEVNMESSNFGEELNAGSKFNSSVGDMQKDKNVVIDGVGGSVDDGGGGSINDGTGLNVYKENPPLDDDAKNELNFEEQEVFGVEILKGDGDDVEEENNSDYVENHLDAINMMIKKLPAKKKKRGKR